MGSAPLTMEAQAEKIRIRRRGSMSDDGRVPLGLTKRA